MKLKITPSSNRTYGFFKSSELKLSKLAHESIDSYYIDWKLLMIANFLRLKTGALGVNSCARTKSYNDTLPNSGKLSQHLVRDDRPVRAMDLRSIKISRKEFGNIVKNNIKMLKFLGLTGVGFYNGFIHIDVRAKKDIRIKGENISVWGATAALDKFIVDA